MNNRKPKAGFEGWFRMQNFDILTLVFLGLAVFVVIKLRSVLGQRTGTERPPREMFERRNEGAPPPAESNVVPMPNVRRDTTPAIPEPEARLAGVIPRESPAFNGLVQVMTADPEFDPTGFVGGARAAYEMIVTAFAQGDRKMLKDLLSRDVYEGFESAIRDRESRNEKQETQFVSIDKAEITDAQMVGRAAQVTVRFLSKLITATRDANGVVIDGSPDKVSDVTDIWTFARETTSRDPNWKLVATEST